MCFFFYFVRWQWALPIYGWTDYYTSQWIHSTNNDATAKHVYRSLFILSIAISTWAEINTVPLCFAWNVTWDRNEFSFVTCFTLCLFEMTFTMRVFTPHLDDVDYKQTEKKVHKRFAFIDFVGQQWRLFQLKSVERDLTTLSHWTAHCFYGLEFRKQFTVSHITSARGLAQVNFHSIESSEILVKLRLIVSFASVDDQDQSDDSSIFWKSKQFSHVHQMVMFHIFSLFLKWLIVK